MFEVKRLRSVQEVQGHWAFPVYQDEKTLGETALALDLELDGLLELARKDGDITGKKDEVVAFPRRTKTGAAKVASIGVGKRGAADLEILRRAGAAIGSRHASKTDAVTFAADDLELDEAHLGPAVQAIAEGFGLALYDFDRFKAKKAQKKATLVFATRSASAQKALIAAVVRAEALIGGTATARDLSNLPANHGTPETLAAIAKSIGKKWGIRVSALGPKELAKKKMGAFLSVALGSPVEPRLIVMEWNGPKKRLPTVALVGKGLTFDSGGISIKPADGMDKMRHDKSGGAVVIGAMEAAARLDLPIRLIGIVPATENMPGGNANKPGDIVTASNGKTIEILNTDAEGRLVLADGLVHAQTFKPDVIIDLATLTGACMIALGSHCAGMMTRDDALAAALEKAGMKTHERVWRLPLWDEYVDEMKGQTSDLKNLGGRYGGALTAAAFLESFAGSVPWAHLDIAGVSWDDSARPYNRGKGATGFGVRLLLEYLRTLAS